MIRKIHTPLSKETVLTLRAGDSCLLSGTLYMARDAAHKRLCELIRSKQPLPFDLRDQVIYFAGPAPARPGQVIGSAGPTTSGRMDAYSPELIAQGLTGMIGKGRRNKAVTESMKKYGAVYFGAIGGCGALIADCILSSETVCYEDLGTEAIRRIEVKDLPVTVVIDAEGNDLYETGRQDYLRQANKNSREE